SSVTANATSTVAMWPGLVGSMWGYRRELRSAEPRMLALVGPSLVGGIAGALLLRWTPPAMFDSLVPFSDSVRDGSVHGAGDRTALAENAHPGESRSLAGAMLFQLMVALYGG